jgi:predicted nuclease with TOPRIM domain
MEDRLEIEHRIINEHELARKEKERLRKLELQRILDQKTQQANERRLNGEWELNDNCPDVGLKAHALLDWLVDTSDVSALTNEDKVEMQRLRDEIERLNDEYDAAEDADTSLLDEISDLEDELTELEEKIDVYNIVPNGGHYDLQAFEVINSDDLQGREYAVGDEDEVKSSCYDYVDGLIDDIGYEGFNGSFAEDYIDEEQVKNYAYDYYYDDVNDNPESFFDDNERELSNQQKDRVLQYNKRKQKIEMTISSLEDSITDTEDEDEISNLEDKISELNEKFIFSMLRENDVKIEDFVSNDYLKGLISDVADNYKYNIEKVIKEYESEKSDGYYYDDEEEEYYDDEEDYIEYEFKSIKNELSSRVLKEFLNWGIDIIKTDLSFLITKVIVEKYNLSNDVVFENQPNIEFDIYEILNEFPKNELAEMLFEHLSELFYNELTQLPEIGQYF